MGRGIANTFPLSLKAVMRQYVTTASVARTDTITATGAGTTSAAPSNATSVKIELWGAGGGGAGNNIGTEYAGGGGGYATITLPVVPGVTTFGYFVGVGGSGGASSANGIVGGSTYLTSGSPDLDISYVAAGGGGGKGGPGVVGAGGLASHWATIGGSGTSGSAAVTTTGGAGAGGGGAGGSTNGQAGTAPGGGGASGFTSGSGGAGAAGQIKFTWYTEGSVWNLRSLLREGSYNTSKGAVGYNGIIPSSGTLNLSDFRGADDIGFTSNTYPTGYSEWNWNQTSSIDTGGTTSANACLTLTNLGRSQGTGNFSTQSGAWLRRYLSTADSTVSGYFDAQFTRTVGTTPNGSSVNTWIQLSSNCEWSLPVSQSGNGSSSKNAKGFLRIRRRSDNTELVNVAVNVYSEATVSTNPCPLCCFTPDTLISMADGTTRAIVAIMVGDTIMVRGGTKQVTEVITRTNRVMYAIRFADGRVLNASEDHPLYVVDKGYAAINPGVGGNYKDLGIPDQLYVGDSVLDSDGRENQIVDITDLDYPETVYTFAESEFYANGMLVY